MSLIADIVAKIFHPGAAHASPPPSPEISNSAGVPSSIAAPSEQPAVDVDQVLTQMASAHKEKLNWRTSIVDLLKVLDMDSSMSARQQLAKELHFEGDTHDSAAMNTWLAKQVLQKLGENGGHMPADLLH